MGAALLITPNGERVLSRLGFDFKRARADDMLSFEVLDGVTFKQLHRAELINAREEYGAPLYTVHRVDMHNELLHLTSTLDLRLSSKVVAADAEQGLIVLEDGTQHHADLIIGADGLHSVLRGVVLGDQDAAKSTPSGFSAFRFMIPTSELENNPHFLELMKVKGRGNSVLGDTTCPTERHMVWYTCRKYALSPLRNENNHLNTCIVDRYKTSPAFTKAYTRRVMVSWKLIEGVPIAT